MLPTKEFFKQRGLILDKDCPRCLTLLNLVESEFPAQTVYGDCRTICEVLLCEILGKNRTQLYLENPLLSGEKLEKFNSYLNSVFSGRPLSFILGKTCFFGLEYYLNKNCFIPRPETEILVEEVIKAADVLADPMLLMFDLCTGIGNIAVSLTKSLSCCRIMATDISQEALKFACRNSSVHKVNDRIDFICCDLVSGIKKGMEADIIVSNPPYIKSGDISWLPENVRQEPLLALDGGFDGLDIIRKLFEVSRFYLKEKGFLIFEFGCEQGQMIEAMAGNSGIIKSARIIKDYNGKDRIFIGRRG